MYLVPEESMRKFKEENQLNSLLDSEMQKILKLKMEDYKKWYLYRQLLMKYAHSNRENRKSSTQQKTAADISGVKPSLASTSESLENELREYSRYPTPPDPFARSVRFNVNGRYSNAHQNNPFDTSTASINENNFEDVFNNVVLSDDLQNEQHISNQGRASTSNIDAMDIDEEFSNIRGRPSVSSSNVFNIIPEDENELRTRRKSSTKKKTPVKKPRRKIKILKRNFANAEPGQTPPITKFFKQKRKYAVAEIPAFQGKKRKENEDGQGGHGLKFSWSRFR